MAWSFFWSPGWSFGALEFWSFGVLLRLYSVVEFWSLGVLDSKLRSLRIGGGALSLRTLSESGLLPRRERGL